MKDMEERPDHLNIKGFTGDPNLGVSKSLSQSLALVSEPITSSMLTPEPITWKDDNYSDSDSDDKPGDAMLVDVGGIVDFVSNID
ncbi:hypothetical protein C0995_007769 [Termitomyces sp. Mi166|nr:hypothetical protein C0995_007769 [Termitomyces sp. Mi166\